MSLMSTTEQTHGDLACLDVDLLLNDAAQEIAELKARLAESEAQAAAAHHRADMALSLNAETDKRYTMVRDERDALAEQVKIVNEELAAAEKDAIPAGTLAYGTLPHDLLLSTYRRVSRVNRGPAPRSVTEAVHNAVPDVRAAMEAAGREIVEATIRREVRRRRRAARR